MTPFKRILVPTDFGSAAARALDLALELAPSFDATVTLLHSGWLPPSYYAAYEGLVWPTDELDLAAKKEFTGALAKAKARYGRVDGVLTSGETWQRILEVAKERNVDLIIMGTHGRRGLSRVFLGSVAEKVVRLAPVPVMTVPGEHEERTRESAKSESTVRRTL